jgi:hypothetical protein
VEQKIFAVVEISQGQQWQKRLCKAATDYGKGALHRSKDYYQQGMGLM